MLRDVVQENGGGLEAGEIMSVAIVTGAGGFLGSHVAERLVADGITVRAIDWGPADNLAALAGAANFSLVQRDMLAMAPDDPVFIGADHLYHCAGISDPSLDAEAYQTANLGTFERALQAAKANGMGKIIYPSSAAVYGNGHWPAREDQPLGPQSPYGISKLLTEEMAANWHRSHGAASIGFRIFNGYGARIGTIGAVGAFLGAIHQGQPITITGDGGQRRDFIHVRDIADAFVRGANSGIEFAIFNLGTGQPRSVAELANLMGADIKYAPATGAPRDMWADMTAITRELDFSPGVTLEDGIADLMKSLS